MSDTFLRGQVVLEYFVLFAVVLLLTLIALSTGGMGDNVRESLLGFFNAAAQRFSN